MTRPVSYSSFVGGELSPPLHGRIDLERFHTGMARVENFVISQYGGMKNRPGTEYVARRGGQNLGAGRTAGVRFRMFAPAADAVYVIEFGPGYLRVLQDGATVLDAGLSAVELPTPYSESDLPLLQFSSSVDVLTVACKGHLPYELTRSGAASPYVWAFGVRPERPDRFRPTLVDFTIVSTVATQNKKDWQYAAAGVDANGIESTPYVSPVILSDGGSGFVAGGSVWLPQGGRVPQPVRVTVGEAPDHYSIYKGLDGVYGFIGKLSVPAGTLPGAQLIFKDYNFAPDYTDQPRKADAQFTSGGTDMPAVVAQFQSRIIFANQPTEPDTFWASAISSLKDFVRYIPVKDNDAMKVTLGSLQLDEIRHIVPMSSQIFMFTSGTEYIVGAEGALTPTNVNVRPISYRGSGWLPPLVVGNVILFVDIAGKVRELVYDQNTNGYPGEDLSLLASHLFVGRTIVDWAVENNDQTVVWCVMSDGKLLSLTYNRDHNVAAWARHSTAGQFRAVCVAREGGHDNVYFAVERAFGLDGGEVPALPIVSIERMKRRSAASPFVDAAQTLSDSKASGNPITISGSFNSGAAANASIASGSFLPTVTIAGISDSEDRELIVTVGGKQYRFHALIVREQNLSLQVIDDFPQASLDVPISEWRLVRSRWIDQKLDAFVGTTVGVQADGDARGEMVVTRYHAIWSGHIIIEPATTIWFGFPYLPGAEGLRLPTRGRTKMGGPIKVYLNETNGLWIGEAADRMVEVKLSNLREVRNRTGLFEVRSPSTWSPTDHLMFEQRKAAPCEILAIDWEVAGGG